MTYREIDPIMLTRDEVEHYTVLVVAAYLNDNQTEDDDIEFLKDQLRMSRDYIAEHPIAEPNWWQRDALKMLEYLV